MQRLIKEINIPKLVCDHIIGDKHTSIHRMSAGVIIMGIGVSISHTTAFFHVVFVQYLGDGFGYLIHAIGTIPFVEVFSSAVSPKKITNGKKEEIEK